VTHDVLDLWAVADRVAVLERGRIVEEGPTTDLLTRPTVGFLARLTGTNLLAGEGREGGVLEVGPGLTLHGQSDPGQPLVPGRPGLASIHPAAISLHVEPPGGSPRTVVEAVVTALEPRGDVVRLRIEAGGHGLAADLTVVSVAELGLVPGSRVWAAVKATQVRLYGRPWVPATLFNREQ
jgi:molybdate transport system ATP-binding protein